MKKTLFIMLICAAALTSCGKTDIEKSTEVAEKTAATSTAEITTTSETTNTEGITTASTTTTEQITTTVVTEPVSLSEEEALLETDPVLIDRYNKYLDTFCDEFGFGRITVYNKNGENIKLVEEETDSYHQLLKEYLQTHDPVLLDWNKFGSIWYVMEVNEDVPIIIGLTRGGDCSTPLTASETTAISFSGDKKYMGIAAGDGYISYRLDDAEELQPLFDLIP